MTRRDFAAFWVNPALTDGSEPLASRNPKFPEMELKEFHKGKQFRAWGLSRVSSPCSLYISILEYAPNPSHLCFNSPSPSPKRPETLVIRPYRTLPALQEPFYAKPRTPQKPHHRTPIERFKEPIPATKAPVLNPCELASGVYGFTVRIYGYEFRVWSLGSRPSSLGFRV